MAEAPLLPRKDQGDAAGEEKGYWRSETGKLAYLALPMVAVSLSQYAVQVSSNMMVGHLPGVLPLSSAAIATSLASVSGFSLLVRTPLIPTALSFFPFACSILFVFFCPVKNVSA
jgi:MATE family multidrug resistance protein